MVLRDIYLYYADGNLSPIHEFYAATPLQLNATVTLAQMF